MNRQLAPAARRAITRVGREQAAAGVFGVAVAAALPLILHLNRKQWFAGDDWALLLQRGLSDPGGLLQRQGDHFTTGPAILYRALFRIVGLHHYWPYQLLVVAAHLLLAVLIWVVMRRARVDPWIACAAGLLLVFFGSGRVNVAVAFQVTLTGSLLFGLAMVLLADHDGPLDRRDVGAAAAGLVALTFSGAAVAMLVAAAISITIRRGWRAAMAVTAGPAAIYALWSQLVPATETSPRATATETLEFARSVWSDSFTALAQSEARGLLLIALLAIGGGLIAATTRRRQVWNAQAATIGLLAGALTTALTLGHTRGALGPFGLRDSAEGRYLYLIAALCLPALALATQALVARWRPVLAGALALLLLGLPGNVRALDPAGPAGLGDRAMVLNIADLADQLDSPRNTRPVLLEGAGPGFVMGPLADARRAGRVPDPPKGSQAKRQYAFLALVLGRTTDLSLAGCRERRGDQTLTLRRAQRLVIQGAQVRIQRVTDGEAHGTALVPLSLTPRFGFQLTSGPVEVAITFPATPGRMWTCP